MIRRILSGVLFVTLTGIVGTGCNNDKKVEESDAAGIASPITLSDVTPDPVEVKLGKSTGTLTFDFSADPLDMWNAKSIRDVIYNGDIDLVVESKNTGVNFALNQGTGVDGDPSKVGEYSVTASVDGTAVTVTFYNSFEGYSIKKEGSYKAVVTVSKNKYFTTESFTRDVSVK